MAAAIVYPGLVLGAYLAYLFWTKYKTPMKYRLIVAGVGLVLALSGGGWTPIWISGQIVAGTMSQAVAGPAALLAAYWLHTRTGVQGSEAISEAGSDTQRTSGVTVGQEEPQPAEPHPEQRPEQRTAETPTEDQPKERGKPMLHLGSTLSGSRPVDIELPDGLERHVFVGGDSGTGKTTTLVRIINDGLKAGYPVILLDAKGTGSLKQQTRWLAGAFGVPFRVVDPTDPDTLSYNPAAGEPALVSNKLVGAFSFGPQAEVFKNVAQEAIPLLAHALLHVGEPVTLKTLARGLSQQQRTLLSNKGGEYGAELADMANRGRVYETGLPGMQARFNSLRYGVYGSIFEVDGKEEVEELDLGESLSSGITYISLPAMASSEDSELMARVVVQDIKQLAAERISRLYSGQGEEVTPALLVMDEFASLREAEQIKDLLGQARESKIATVISSLHLPKDQELKKMLLAAGLLLTHEVGEEDAKEIAKTIGSRERMDVSTSFKADGDEDEDRRITGRKVEKYLIEPRDIQRLGRGKAAMKLRYGDVQRVERVKVGPVYRPINEQEKGRQ